MDHGVDLSKSNVEQRNESGSKSASFPTRSSRIYNGFNWSQTDLRRNQNTSTDQQRIVQARSDKGVVTGKRVWNKNAVMLLHELAPSATHRLVSRTGPRRLRLSTRARQLSVDR